MNRHDFLVLFCLCSELKLEDIYSGEDFCGKMFAVIFICGNLFLRIAEKIVKIRTCKDFVPHGRLSDRRYSSSKSRNFTDFCMEEMNLLSSIETYVKLRDSLELYLLVSFQQITLTLT